MFEPLCHQQLHGDGVTYWCDMRAGHADGHYDTHAGYEWPNAAPVGQHTA